MNIHASAKSKGEIKLMGITVGSTNGKNMISTKDDISQNSEDKRNHRKYWLFRR
jgi:hypothetical protein